MTRSRNKAGIGGIAPALFAVAGLALALPTAVFAVSSIQVPAVSTDKPEFANFTPAAVDPLLARRVADSIRAKGQAIRFTPANLAAAKDKTFTVAVRVDDQTARAISIRTAIEGMKSDAGLRTVNIAPTRYNLGIARGYQGFVKTPNLPKTDISLGLQNVALPDLAQFKPAEGSVKPKPSRLQPHISLEAEKGTTGRAKGTLEALGEQTVDLGGAYRVTRNLNVTAGVRLSQDRDRIAPLTDSVQDSQAVYVGTQFRF